MIIDFVQMVSKAIELQLTLPPNLLQFCGIKAKINLNGSRRVTQIKNEK